MSAYLLGLYDFHDVVYVARLPYVCFPQSGHVSLHTPDCLYLSCTGGGWDRSFHMLLLVRNAILTFVCLKSFVM
jgi:hypothetical protein